MTSRPMAVPITTPCTCPADDVWTIDERRCLSCGHPIALGESLALQLARAFVAALGVVVIAFLVIWLMPGRIAP